MKVYIILILMAIAMMIQVAPVSAWSVTNHYQIAEATYNGLPLDIQSKLSLSEMKNGSDDPDTKFFDFSHHTYPNTKNKAEYWLNKGKHNYDNGNYKYASYCYGVATHYIADGFCGPHTKAKSSRYYHTIYEIRAMFLSPQTTYYSGDFDLIMNNNHLKSEKSWKHWLKEGDDYNIQKDLNRASSASYSLVKNSILS
ncbi:zinc dependent phospholipase C family protein [Methanobacterium alcaliphilum]|uniref:zinc dependent phospholipase C family protein n=1 Tax=Methanobacterium alcaliphilum TaxID=392018 RepID=UPI00200A275B|nr:zinc dependent phospholipase C family protein [Methanobacterium alcaliphilum]MCK9151567.1 zinc dependent phospholipase C family protein [Methanobacterium alcaliphilum]